MAITNYEESQRQLKYCLPKNSETRALAKRMVWFMDPDDALDDPLLVILYSMQFGTQHDLPVLQRYVDSDTLRSALENARPGILDERSWSYWHAMTGTFPPPPLPQRAFPETEKLSL